MAFVVWKDAYSVGVAELDSQHQKLFGMINALFDAMRLSRADETLAPTFDGLVDYVSEHFAHEEKLMEQCSYPELADQKAAHSCLTTKIAAFKRRFYDGDVAVARDLLSVLKTWLVEHILISDKKYGPHLNRHGIL